MQFWTKEECSRQIYGETFLLEHFAGTTLILLTAKIRHMERFHYRAWRTNMPLLKLFHGWAARKETGENEIFPSTRKIKYYRRRNQKCVRLLSSYRKSFVFYFSLCYSRLDKFCDLSSVSARSYDKISRTVWRITP